MVAKSDSHFIFVVYSKTILINFRV